MSQASRAEEITPTDSPDDTAVAGIPVVVRRHAGLAALIGAAASAVSIGYLWRASQTMTVLDWALCLVTAGIAAVHLTALLDSRIPLLVADDLGVRIRLGAQWRGLPWEAVERVVVSPRRGPLRDGRIMFAPRSLARALDGLDVRGRRQVSLNQKMYGAALAVPVGLTTRVSTSGERSVVEEIEALSRGRAQVVDLTPEGPAAPEAPETGEVHHTTAGAEAISSDTTDNTSDATSADTTDTDDTREEAPTGPVPDDRARESVAVEDVVVEPVAGKEAGDEVSADEVARPVRRSLLGGIGTVVSRVAKGRSHDVDGPGHAEHPDRSDTDPGLPEPPAPPRVTVPLRDTRPGQRAEVTRDLPATLGDTAAGTPGGDPAPEARRMHRPGSVDLVLEPAVSDRVRPISTMGDPVEPLVIDDFATEPAYDPVIGPELAAARTRLGLSIDELADRTRIRPHVLESIEVDDFAPCGGDFYARGHLRTAARVLGKDPGPLLETFEERYATAPVNARRVFEAELATGMTGSMRSTIGGPNWGLLIGVVICLVLVWGVVRLFAGEPPEVVHSPAPVLNGSAGVASSYAGAADPAPVTEPLPIMLTAAYGDTLVVVRDGNGRIAFSGGLVLGEKKRLQVAPPVRVRAVDAGAIEVTVHGRDRGVLGELGHPGRRTFRNVE